MTIRDKGRIGRQKWKVGRKKSKPIVFSVNFALEKADDMKKGIIAAGILASVLPANAHMKAIETSDTTACKELQEVVVVSQSAQQRQESKRLGAEKLELGKLAQLPQLFGERDIFKTITLMPGVHSEGDGGGGFEVRGGNSSQNLILLDGMTLYNPSHVLGIFSTFNSDAINRATLFKGPIPASYGEAISSTLDAGLATGDMEEYHGNATIGILAAKLKIGGPIVKDKLSFAVTARRTYIDAFLKMTNDYKNTTLNFYDITAKIRYIPSYNDIIDLSMILARDNMALNRLMGMEWGNYAGSINWVHTQGDKLRFTTTVSATDYSPKMWMSVMQTNQTMRQYIRNFNATEKIDYALDEKQNLQFGYRSEYLQVESGEMLVGTTVEKEVRSGWLNAAWVNYEGELDSHWGVETGVRFSLMDALEKHEFKSVFTPTPDFGNRLHFDTEFRINAKYSINNRHNIKFGIGDVTQNLHAIRSSATTFPFDRYALTSLTIEPERSFQLGLGYSGMTPDGSYDWAFELYHRDCKNTYDYRDGLTMFSSINLESLILGGKGRSYGAEMMIRKNSGKLTGWMSYTISKTQSKINGINSGKWYDSTNDRRHDFNITAIYNFNSSWNISASWVFTSGTPITAPDQKYELDGTTCYYYSQRNGYRTPSTHHLDLSANYKKEGRHVTQELSFGFYNVYNHYNPYVIYFEDDASKPSGTRAVQQSLYGIIPSVSYTIKF